MAVRLRLTDKCPPDFRRRMLTYRTRHLVADDPDVIELSDSEALVLLKAGFADEFTAPKRGPGRPPKAKAEQEPDPIPAEPEVPESTHAELMARAEELGVELPSGYVRKDELAALIDEAEKAEDGDAA